MLNVEQLNALKKYNAVMHVFYSDIDTLYRNDEIDFLDLCQLSTELEMHLNVKDCIILLKMDDVIDEDVNDVLHDLVMKQLPDYVETLTLDEIETLRVDCFGLEKAEVYISTIDTHLSLIEMKKGT